MPSLRDKHKEGKKGALASARFAWFILLLLHWIEMKRANEVNSWMVYLNRNEVPRELKLGESI